MANCVLSKKQRCGDAVQAATLMDMERVEIGSGIIGTTTKVIINIIRNSKPKLLLRGEVNGKKCIMTVDTAADNTVINSSLFKGMAPCRIPFYYRDKVDSIMEEMNQQNAIEPCNGPWASPVVLVPKKGDEIPYQEDILNMVLPFGLCNTPATFVKLMNIVLEGLLDDLAFQALQKLKQILTSTPILGYPDPNYPFILDTDASNIGIGAVLSQKIPVNRNDETVYERKVIAYFSKTLKNRERNYCVTRKELLAVVISVEHFRHFLLSKRFTIRTDHASLTWLLSFKNPQDQIARWFEILFQYDFEVQHRPGHKHGNADGLSWRPCDCKKCFKENKVPEFNDVPH
ncbi:uncharacterized protein [Chelonus insularis]|uniref:uncharacterized protein n=1 Tax=Chelonus insularis TaxID=460826 RepID=UPI00158B09AA|nr:uncharacterized protein LOC118074157 [Chelonus insularis]